MIVLISAIGFEALCHTPCMAIDSLKIKLTGPAMIKKGQTATYSWTLTGNNAGDIIGTPVLWSVYDQDTGFLAVDDLLVKETLINLSDALGTTSFTYTATFDLKCLDNCHIMGSDGTTDDPAPPDAQVFVLIEQPFTGLDYIQSDNLDVTCMAVPEPGMGVLGGVALLGAAAARRRRG
jgi:hypothetical protein